MLTKPQNTELNMRLIVILCVLALVLTIWQHRSNASGQMSMPERVGKYIVWPLQSVATSIFGWEHDVAISLAHSRELVEDNRRLKGEVDRLTHENLTLNEYFLENKQLKEKLGFVLKGEEKGIPARVIGRSGPSSNAIFTIESMNGHSIDSGNIVLTGKGLVGRVISARKTVADVMLLSHRDHAVAALVQRSRDQGMVYTVPNGGPGGRLLQMERLRGQADVRVGDTILTSHISGIYPANIKIGTVVRIETAPASSQTFRAIIKPAADLDNVDYVLVMRGNK